MRIIAADETVSTGSCCGEVNEWTRRAHTPDMVGATPTPATNIFMADDTITLVSSTDSEADVLAALGAAPPAEPEKKPAAAPPPAPAAAAPPATPPAAEPPPVPADAKPPEPEAKPPASETPEQKADRERKSGFEKRKAQLDHEINALTANKYNLRRDVEAEEARLADLRRQREQIETQIAEGKKTPPAAPAPAPAPPPAPALRAEPQLGDRDEHGNPRYETYEAYLSDHAKWVDEKVVAATEAIKRETEARVQAAIDADRKTREEHEKAERERIDRESALRAQQEAVDRHNAKVEDFKKTHADFDAVVDASMDVVGQLRRERGERVLDIIDGFAVHDAEHGAEVIYHLASHPDELRQIAALPVRQQLVALSKLDQRLGDASKPVSGPPPRVTPVTAAPEPIVPVSSSPTPSTVSPDDEDYQTYKARRAREEAARLAHR